jgi:molybdate transport system substrate-binding protein
LVKKVHAGESADLLILTKQGLDELIKGNKVAPGSDSSFVSSGMAVVVKKGARKLDISTPRGLQTDAAQGQIDRLFESGLRRRQRRILRQNAGADGHCRSGQEIDPLPAAERQFCQSRCERRSRTRDSAGTGSDGGARRRGHRAAAGDLNNITTYSAGVSPDNKDPNAAKAMIKFLKTPEAAAVFKARGLKPV